MHFFFIIERILSKTLTKIIITLFILFFLFKKVDLFTIKNYVQNINSYYWTLYFFLSLPLPLLFALKWAYYLNTLKLKISYYKFIKSVGLSDIFNTGLFIEIFKFNTLKNFSLSKKISCLIIEKFFVLSSKTIITIFLLWLYIYYYHYNKIIIFSLFILPLLFLLINFDSVILNLLNFIKKKYSIKIINTVSNAIDSFKDKFSIIFFIDFLRNILLLVLYYFILINFFNNKTVMLILIFLPFVESLLKIFTFSFFGLREVLIFYMGGLLKINQLSMVTASVILSLNLTLINILLLTILATQNYFLKIKKK